MLTEDQQIFDQIKKANNILITFKKACSGDALGSALALSAFLNKLNKKNTIAVSGCNEKIKNNFNFLPGIKNIENHIDSAKKFIISVDTSSASAQEISYQIHDSRLDFIITPKDGQFKHQDISSRQTGSDFDLIIVLATPDLESIEDIYHHNTELFYNAPIINIDYRPDNEEFGQINKVKITAISTAEIIFELIKEYNGELIDASIATCLLTGIIAESKSFKIGGLTPKSLVSASQLINLGANRETIVRHLYQNRKLNTLRLWGRVLAKLKNDLNRQLIWSALNQVDFDKTNTDESHLEDVIEELITNVPEAQVIVILSANSHPGSHANIYTTKNINAAALLKELEAKGNKDRAEVVSTKPLAELETELIEHIKKKLAKLPL